MRFRLLPRGTLNMTALSWLQFMAGIHAEGVAWSDCKVDNMMVRSLELTEDKTCLKHGVTFLDFGGATSTQDGELTAEPGLAVQQLSACACLSASSRDAHLLTSHGQAWWAPGLIMQELP